MPPLSSHFSACREMISFMRITHGSSVCLTLSEVDEDAAALMLIVLRHDDDEISALAPPTKAPADWGRGTALPLVRAIVRVRNLAVFPSTGAGMAVLIHIVHTLVERAVR